jgi:hypothetical protein
MERHRLVRFAQVVADLGGQVKEFPPGGRIVVIVTDEAGTYVGVGTNTTNEDTENILRCALEGEDRQDLVVTVHP